MQAQVWKYCMSNFKFKTKNWVSTFYGTFPKYVKNDKQLKTFENDRF